MGSQEMFNGTISILEKSLDMRSMKHNLLVSNIANKDTPNYKAFDLAVEEEMQKLTGYKKTVSLWKTQKGHFSANGEACDKVSITKSSKGFEQGMDGNTVDIEKEMTNLAENNLQYRTNSEMLMRKLSLIKYSITEGGR